MVFLMSNEVRMEILPDMTASYLLTLFQKSEVKPVSVTVRKNRDGTFQFGIVKFPNNDIAEDVVKQLNGKRVPDESRPDFVFQLNRRKNGRPTFPVMVTELSSNIDDIQLYKFFMTQYSSTALAKIMRDDKGASEGFGVVRFFEKGQQRDCLQRKDITGPGKKQIKIVPHVENGLQSEKDRTEVTGEQDVEEIEKTSRSEKNEKLEEEKQEQKLKNSEKSKHCRENASTVKLQESGEVFKTREEYKKSKFSSNLWDVYYNWNLPNGRNSYKPRICKTKPTLFQMLDDPNKQPSELIDYNDFQEDTEEINKTVLEQDFYTWDWLECSRWLQLPEPQNINSRVEEMWRKMKCNEDSAKNVQVGDKSGEQIEKPATPPWAKTKSVRSEICIGDKGIEKEVLKTNGIPPWIKTKLAKSEVCEDAVKDNENKICEHGQHGNKAKEADLICKQEPEEDTKHKDVKLSERDVIWEQKPEEDTKDKDVELSIDRDKLDVNMSKETLRDDNFVQSRNEWQQNVKECVPEKESLGNVEMKGKDSSDENGRDDDHNSRNKDEEEIKENEKMREEQEGKKEDVNEKEEKRILEKNTLRMNREAEKDIEEKEDEKENVNEQEEKRRPLEENISKKKSAEAAKCSAEHVENEAHQEQQKVVRGKRKANVDLGEETEIKPKKIKKQLLQNRDMNEDVDGNKDVKLLKQSSKKPNFQGKEERKNKKKERDDNDGNDKSDNSYANECQEIEIRKKEQPLKIMKKNKKNLVQGACGHSNVFRQSKIKSLPEKQALRKKNVGVKRKHVISDDDDDDTDDDVNIFLLREKVKALKRKIREREKKKKLKSKYTTHDESEDEDDDNSDGALEKYEKTKTVIKNRGKKKKENVQLKGTADNSSNVSAGGSGDHDDNEQRKLALGEKISYHMSGENKDVNKNNHGSGGSDDYDREKEVRDEEEAKEQEHVDEEEEDKESEEEEEEEEKLQLDLKQQARYRKAYQKTNIGYKKKVMKQELDSDDSDENGSDNFDSEDSDEDMEEPVPQKRKKTVKISKKKRGGDVGAYNKNVKQKFLKKKAGMFKKILSIKRKSAEDAIGKKMIAEKEGKKIKKKSCVVQDENASSCYFEKKEKPKLLKTKVCLSGKKGLKQKRHLVVRLSGKKSLKQKRHLVSDNDNDETDVAKNASMKEKLQKKMKKGVAQNMVAAHDQEKESEEEFYGKKLCYPRKRKIGFMTSKVVASKDISKQNEVGETNMDIAENKTIQENEEKSQPESVEDNTSDAVDSEKIATT